jgi:hypothetical protein
MGKIHTRSSYIVHEHDFSERQVEITIYVTSKLFQPVEINFVGKIDSIISTQVILTNWVVFGWL